jgi:hypothetical protein
LLSEKVTLKITSILASSRGTQARHKDFAKVTLKFIRVGTEGREMGAKTQDGSPLVL